MIFLLCDICCPACFMIALTFLPSHPPPGCSQADKAALPPLARLHFTLMTLHLHLSFVSLCLPPTPSLPWQSQGCHLYANTHMWVWVKEKQFFILSQNKHGPQSLPASPLSVSDWALLIGHGLQRERACCHQSQVKCRRVQGAERDLMGQNKHERTQAQGGRTSFTSCSWLSRFVKTADISTLDTSSDKFSINLTTYQFERTVPLLTAKRQRRVFQQWYFCRFAVMWTSLCFCEAHFKDGSSKQDVNQPVCLFRCD